MWIGKRFVVRGRVARCEISSRRTLQILIGNRVFLNQGAVIGRVESIEIGDDSLIGDFCAIYDSNYHASTPGTPISPGRSHRQERLDRQWRAGAAGQPDRRPYGRGRQVGRQEHSAAAGLGGGQPRQGHPAARHPRRMAEGLMPATCAQSHQDQAATVPAVLARAVHRPRHYSVNDHRLVTSRSMSGVLNFCEAETDLCRLLPQVKCLTLKSHPRYFVRIAQETGRDV